MKTNAFLSFTLICMTLYGQNLEVTPKDGASFLLGKLTLDALEQQPYQTWYNQSYQDYEVDKIHVRRFKKKLANHKIQLFLGTWCGDSRREVPRFLKVLDQAEFPMENLEIIALDPRKEWYKKSPGGEERGKNIIRVPTMLFLKNDAEINRIVESPIESLEKDMALILRGKSYTPNYAQKKL